MHFGTEGECVTVRPTRSAHALPAERKEYLNGSPGEKALIYGLLVVAKLVWREKESKGWDLIF